MGNFQWSAGQHRAKTQMFQSTMSTITEGKVAQNYISSQGFQHPAPRCQASAKPVKITNYSTYTTSTGQPGPEDQPQELLILGKCRSRSEGFFVLPSVLSLTSKQETTVLAVCTDLPCFIPQRLSITQANLLPESNKESAPKSSVIWTKITSRNCPQLTCIFELNTGKVTQDS